MGTKTIWDGTDLPPEGCEVLIQLGSLTDKKNRGGWVRHAVTGYRVKPVTDNRLHSVVFVQVGKTDEPNSSTNERVLCDVRPLDWREPE